MNKIKELFGVELEEKFDIESESYGRINNCCFVDSLWILFVPHANNFRALILLAELINGEAKIIKHKKPILDDAERKYLKNIIKIFKVDHIVKGEQEIHERNVSKKYFITICLENGGEIVLPSFSLNSGMYKGIKPGKLYTPEELGL